MKYIKEFFILVFLSFCYSNFVSATEDYWQQFVHYNFGVCLNTEKHTLSGDGTILYKNNSPDTLNKIYLHLYPNAFKDNNSTMARESKDSYYYRPITPKNNGYIDILELRIMNNNSKNLASNAPVAAYRVDDTILETNLPEPLLPGGKIQIYIKFYEKITSIVRRGGRKGEQYDLAQWYPKLVVYDQKGWHPDQYHSKGEFYGEFGTFDVSITLPYNYIIGATGVVVEGDPGWSWVKVDTALSDEEWEECYDNILTKIEKQGKLNKERTVKFHAENVHDFAWLTSPDFLYEYGEWNSIPVHVLYRSYVKNKWSKVVTKRGERTLKWLSEIVGMYPYPQLSITHGLLGGGMEYPMLVMNSSSSESLIVHEVGHIYFYGILASDELAESWMDEGGTCYQELLYQEQLIGDWSYKEDDEPDVKSWDFKFNPRLKSRERETSSIVNYLTSGFNEPTSMYAHKFNGGYYINAYSKGAAIYGMLHSMVGDSLWDEIMHTYFDRWKFKHVNEQRFKDVCEDVTGMDLKWYFDQWLHRTDAIDYALGKISKEKQPDGQWRTDVEIKRKENGIMPVDVQVVAGKDHQIIKRWNGQAKSGNLTFVTSEKPQKIILDPKDSILDNNRMNNGNMKIEVLPDIPPVKYYRPRNSYVIKVAPKMWYNDVDAFWMGLRLRGDYMGRLERSEVGFKYGFKSENFGYNFSFQHPLLPNSDKMQLEIAGINQEGRAIGNIGVTYRTSKGRNISPHNILKLSFNSAQMLKGDEEYCQRKVDIGNKIEYFQEWQSGRVNKIVLDYLFEVYKRKYSSKIGFSLESSQEVWGSEFDYSRLQSELSFKLNRSGNSIACRWFGGVFLGDEAPVQEQFFTDGANPRNRFEKFYLRSLSALPPELHYFAPGGGNMRGYVEQPFAAERILAVNSEFSTNYFHLIFRKIIPRYYRLKFFLFFDSARIIDFDENYKNLQDAGFGFSITNYPLNLNVSFPIWVSNPLPGDKETKFRWVVSFSSAI